MPNFTANANTFTVAGKPVAADVLEDTQALAASGAITIISGVVRLTTGLIAATLQVPDYNGQRLTIVSEFAAQHTITTLAPGYNGVGTALVLTMSPLIGDSIRLESADGAWYVVKGSANAPSGTGQPQVLAANGAITIKNGSVQLTKGSIGAYTIAAPTALVDDGLTLYINSTTAFAHVITSGVDGFNAKGSSGTATFSGTLPNSFVIQAYNGHWYQMGTNLGVTIA